jgi:hypothetical protein
LRNTTKNGLEYGRGSINCSSVVVFVDFDYTSDLNKSRSFTCYVFTLFGCTISWKATLQLTVALFTIEAKYIIATKVTNEAIWLKGFVGDFGL